MSDSMFKARRPKAAFDYSRWYILKDQMCKLLLRGCCEVIIVKWDTISGYYDSH